MKSTAVLALAALLAACATTPPPAPEPVVAAPAPEPAPPPAPEPPPPPPPPEHPMQMEDGPWRVGIYSERVREHAEADARFVDSYHLRTAIETVKVKDTTWYRVVLPGYASKEDAQAMIDWLDKKSVKGGWIVAPGRKSRAKPAPQPDKDDEPVQVD